MNIIIKKDEYKPKDAQTIAEDGNNGFHFVHKGKEQFACVGCDKIISFREFDDNKGYCADCRDGKNEAYYRAMHK